MYRETNPKIDLYDKEGRYLASTKWYRTIKGALAAESAKKLGAVKGRRSNA